MAHHLLITCNARSADIQFDLLDDRAGGLLLGGQIVEQRFPRFGRRAHRGDQCR